MIKTREEVEKTEQKENAPQEIPKRITLKKLFIDAIIPATVSAVTALIVNILIQTVV